jgi:hypothetical protein
MVNYFRPHLNRGVLEYILAQTGILVPTMMWIRLKYTPIFSYSNKRLGGKSREGPR